MTDFKSGGVPNPDYDSEDINFVNQKTEFTEDVFVYGKLYGVKLISERIKLSSASLMPNLFKDTCASKRYFHFVRFILEMCEESMVN